MRFSKQLLAIYKTAPFRYKLYTMIRFAICPFDKIEKYVPSWGKILDCGCGHGVFANYLAIKSKKRYIIAIDTMESKINIALSSSQGNNIEFRVSDVRKSLSTKDIGCATLIDVLHYFPIKEKIIFLNMLKNTLQDKGMLIIKSIQELPRWKYWFTLFHVAVIDKLMHRSFHNNNFFLRKEEYLSLLRGLGFDVSFVDISKGYPYSHCLYICKKVD